MKAWHHLDCLFDAFTRARATTKKLEDETEIDGWDDLQDDDQQKIREKIRGVCLLFQVSNIGIELNFCLFWNMKFFAPVTKAITRLTYVVLT